MLADHNKPAEAEAEFRQVLDARMRILGPDHPQTLGTRYNLARALADQGRAPEAEAEFRQLLDVELRVFGPDHRATLATRRQLGLVQRQR